MRCRSGRTGGTAALFVLVTGLLAEFYGGGGGYPLVMVAMVGAYMAMNIGANDVAGHLGLPVSSTHITIGAVFGVLMRLTSL